MTKTLLTLGLLLALLPARAASPREDLARAALLLQAGREQEALPALFRAAAADDPYAQNILALILYRGQSVARNCELATEWWEKAARQNLPQAQYNLGLCYALGCGVPPSPEQAVHWWKLAAEQGMPDAAYNLALCYRHGYGVERNAQLEKTYLQLAGAQQPDTRAQNSPTPN